MSECFWHRTQQYFSFTTVTGNNRPWTRQTYYWKNEHDKFKWWLQISRKLHTRICKLTTTPGVRETPYTPCPSSYHPSLVKSKINIQMDLETYRVYTITRHCCLSNKSRTACFTSDVNMLHHRHAHSSAINHPTCLIHYTMHDNRSSASN